MINRENYEVFVIDYLDGNLDPLQVAELMLFIEQNPDLDIPLDDFKELTIRNDVQLSAIEKEQLKVRKGEISQTNVVEYLVAEMDNELSDQERLKLNDFIGRNPKYKKQQVELSLTQLIPDLTIKFPNKQQLKRRRGVVIPFYVKVISVAAALLLLFNIYLKNDGVPQNELVITTSSINNTAATSNTDSALIKASVVSNTIVKEKHKNKSRKTEDQPNKAKVLVAQAQPVLTDDNTKEEPTLVAPESSTSSEAMIAYSETKEIKEITSDSPEEIPSLKELLAQRFLSSAPSQSTTEDEKPAKKSWTFAALAVNAYNKIAGKDIELSKEVSEDGIVHYELKANNFEFSRKTQKEF